MSEKICTQCFHVKDINEFYKNPGMREGVVNTCKECRILYSKNRRAITKEHRRWSAGRLMRHFREKHKKKKWPEMEIISIVDIRSIISNPCIYCGNIDSPRGIDRIDNHMGYVSGNCLSCCHECNLARSNKFTVEEMINEIGPAISRIRNKRKLTQGNK